jgi:hypothetical protein
VKAIAECVFTEQIQRQNVHMIVLMLVALTCGLFVARVKPIVDDNGDEQHDAADDVLRLGIHVHDGKSVEQRADQRAADDDTEYAAAAADQTDAAEHHNEDDVENLRANDHGIGLHVAGLADPDQPGEPCENRNQYMLQ